MEIDKIKDTFEKQIERLFERSQEADSVKEICSLNKEMCRTAKVLFKVLDLQLGN